jgi:NADH-quinone oxidoreductase subunit K
MCVEMMLNAGQPGFRGRRARPQDDERSGFVFFVMAVAAAEVAVGLAIIVALFRNRATIDVDEVNLLKY